VFYGLAQARVAKGRGNPLTNVKALLTNALMTCPFSEDQPTVGVSR
jgi:hypothetical protein